MREQPILPYLRSLLGIFLLTMIQQTFIPYIEILHFTPDIVLIGLFVIAVRQGQVPATAIGFAAGLATDLFVGEVIGISALANTIAAFIAGYYFDEEKVKVIVRTPKFITITVICTFVHNLIYLFAYIRSVDIDLLRIFLTYGIGATVYTSVISVIVVLIIANREQRVKAA